MKRLVFIFFILLAVSACKEAPTEPIIQESPTSLPSLSSWNEGKNKEAIQAFIQKTTDPNSPDFVAENLRVAVFDNDGTLWGEQPFYFQLAYAIDFVKQESKNHPEWTKDPILKAAIDGDMKGIMAGGEKGLIELVMQSHAQMTEDEFSQNVKNWLASAKHPETNKPYHHMVYQPMLELLDYLRENGYKTFIVSGGGIDFLRVFAEEAYGIPPYQVVGSSIKAVYQERDGKMAVVKTSGLNFIDDKAGKPVGIHQHIGMKPIIAVGNSDGDFQMLEYTTSAEGPRLGILLHHTDAEREFAYDSLSHIGQLKRGLVEGPNQGWLILDMAKDWAKIYPEQ
jgi:phosphoglycolate phosphatase-like HAD superfamily hydrolase